MLCARHFLRSVFVFPESENRQNFNTGNKQQRTLMLVVYPLPDKGHRYSIRRGSGLFIGVRRLAMPRIQ